MPAPVPELPDARLLAAYKQQTVMAVMQQTRKTSEFLALYAFLRESRVTPLVVKGIVCRTLYPKSGQSPLRRPRIY